MSLRTWLSSASGAFARAAGDALVWHIATAVIGAVAVVVGVGMQFGAGWAWMSCGVALLAGSAYIKRGLSNE